MRFLGKARCLKVIGLTVLVFFSFQLIANTAVNAGLVHCDCESANQQHQDKKDPNGQGTEPNHCICSCHCGNSVNLPVLNFEFNVNPSLQFEILFSDGILEESLARSIFLPPRLG